MEKLIEMNNIMKSFPGVKALDNVSFSLNAGEILALAGANGAGKSTLIKIMTGVYTRDAGDVFVMGQPVHFQTPKEAKAMGIAAIYQELTVIPNLTVMENIFINEIAEKNVIDYKTYNQKAEKLLRDLDVEFRATDRVGKLSVANQQMVEIARAVNENSKVLIMDEPTSALTETEKEKLFSIVRGLRDKGVGVIFVTHRLKEMFELCSRVTIMKDGCLVGHYSMDELDEHGLVELMLSRSMSNFYPERHSNVGDVILQVKNLKCQNRVKDVSFELHKGEVLGLTGLLGSGRTESACCLFGILHPEAGEILLDGKPVKFRDPVDAVRHRIAMVPEDRKETGLVLNMSIVNNICFGSDVVGGIRNIKQENEIGDEYIKKLQVVCPNGKQKVGNLSGGNQQKVVIAKWLLRQAKIVILDEPTRGIDVAAKAEIYKLIDELAGEGTAVLVISSELEEIMGICDRAVVLYEGVTVGELDRSEFEESRLLQMSHNN